MHHIICDLGFGDSGKGAMTDRIAAQRPGCVVVRYTGGSQAAHNVVIGDKNHIHQAFASGALAGVESHMSAFCPLNPENLVREARELEAKNGLKTLSYCSIDPLCPLITPYDRAWNQFQAIHGREAGNTVGAGVGATMRRHETSPHRIFAVDLLYPDMYRIKLREIGRWYREKHNFLPKIDWAIPDVLDHVRLVPTGQVLAHRGPVVFEGAQGVLLDRDHGFFPNVTYGHTTMRNAMELLKLVPGNAAADIQYVIRGYITRHGDGPMGSGASLDLPDEHNLDGGFQGPFRAAEMDYGLLSYAMAVNEAYATPRCGARVLNVTCIDRLPEYDLAKFRKATTHPACAVRGWFGADRIAANKFHI